MKKIYQWAYPVIVAGMAVLGCLALAFLVLTFQGCAAPTMANDPIRIVVKNSLWQTVKTITISDRGAREVVGDDYVQEIEAYNAETLDDFLRAYEAGEVPDIANAPPVSVYICNPVTYEVNSFAEGITRQALIDDIALWRQQAYGQILFIDHVPPPPIVVPPPSLYAWYAIYMVDNVTGEILLEDHCGYLPDESFDGEWITDPQQGGWSSVDAYYNTILHAYQVDFAVMTGQAHVITRQLYTEPAP